MFEYLGIFIIFINCILHVVVMILLLGVKDIRGVVNFYKKIMGELGAKIVLGMLLLMSFASFGIVMGMLIGLLHWMLW